MQTCLLKQLSVRIIGVNDACFFLIVQITVQINIIDPRNFIRFTDPSDQTKVGTDGEEYRAARNKTYQKKGKNTKADQTGFAAFTMFVLLMISRRLMIAHSENDCIPITKQNDFCRYNGFPFCSLNE